MASSDKEGELDKYFYSYDNSDLISEIQRNRRGLEAVSGQYDYKYDAIGRLTESSHNGQVKSTYEYDAFGNRTSLVEENTKTAYKYDVLDRLVEAKELNNSQAIVKTYDYDKRGNQTKEFVDGLLQKTFTFDATNMLAKVTDANKGELENQYNGLGYRVASTRPEEKIEYLCDLSRDYYNLLERTVNGETESFVYDNNVISMSKAGNSYYYLQDELGSPMYMTGTDGVAVSSYAFDDFGRNIDPRTGKQRKHEYKVEGNIIQPFAFTGYQEDEVSGLKFAQARFYDASTGRFQSEDNVKGFIETPFTLNHYGYCWENPVGIVDNDGNIPKWMSKGLDAVKKGASDVAEFAYDHPTATKIVAGAVVAAACVAAAPVVLTAVTTTFAAGSISAAAATIATTTIVGAGVSGVTSVINQAVDNRGAVNWKKVGIDTLKGGLKGFAVGGLAVLGAGGGILANSAVQFLGKTVSNMAIDTAGDFATAKLVDKNDYGWWDAAKSAGSSAFSTVAGHFIGKGISKLLWPDKILGRLTNIDVNNSTAKALYEGYSGMQSNRNPFGMFKSGMDYYDRETYDALVGYITSNFVNYDRGVIKKEVKKLFGAGYDYLVDIICNDVKASENCNES